jgi:hypothetical protein
MKSADNAKSNSEIPRSETFFSQPATDPSTIIVIFGRIDGWLTKINLDLGIPNFHRTCLRERAVLSTVFAFTTEISVRGD